jgi:DNA-binding NarL/FixJ family response regulator
VTEVAGPAGEPAEPAEPTGSAEPTRPTGATGATGATGPTGPAEATEPPGATGPAEATEPPGAPAAPRVVIADDQTLVRSGFRMILGAAGIPVVAEAADGQEAVAAVLKHRPDVVLMDIRMPEMDGLEATRRILAARPGRDSRIIILTTFDFDEYVYAALTAGASGFLLKDVTPEQLVAAVRTVRSGDALLAPSITRRLVERFAAPSDGPAIHRDLSGLTPRELEVLRLLSRGLSNAELAEQLTLSEATIKTHVARILAKLQLRDRVQAVVLAYETGLVGPGRLA